jgi:hypothetical protein
MDLMPIPSWRFRWNDRKEQDLVDTLRRQRLAEINQERGERATLEARFGQVWDTDQLSQEVEVQGFMAPFIVVRRKSDGVMGSLEFQHHPRFHFNFAPDNR